MLDRRLGDRSLSNRTTVAWRDIIDLVRSMLDLSKIKCQIRTIVKLHLLN